MIKSLLLLILEPVFMAFLLSQFSNFLISGPLYILKKSIEDSKEPLCTWVNENISKTQEYIRTHAINHHSSDVIPRL